MQEARRASAFLAEWRRLVGCAQLGIAAAPPGRHLRRLAARLQPGRFSGDALLFAGGPSYAELEALAALDDEALTARLKDGCPAGPGLPAMTWGPAALLAAEVAELVLGPAS